MLCRLYGRLEYRLRRDLRVDLDPVKRGEIGLVQISKALFHVHISIEENIAVGGVIISAVEVQKRLIGQVRDVYGIAAGLHSVRSMRIQRAVNAAGQHIIGRRKSSLHLIVDDAVNRDRALRVLCLIMPALLAEDILLYIDVRIEHCVKIDVHQVLEIRVIAARHRIYSLIRVSHRVKECVERTLYQLNERVLDREIP